MNNLPPCPFCRQPPTIYDLSKMLVGCGTEGCPPFTNAVTAEVWCKRGVHETEVMKIPDEEPIFILRAQDQLALVAVYTWIDLAERKGVNEDKINQATADAAAMDSYQRNVKAKLPD